MRSQYKSQLLLILIFVTSFFAEAVSEAYIPLIPHIASDVGDSFRVIEFIVPCFFIGKVIAQLLSGFVQLKKGKKFLFVTSLIVCALGSGLISRTEYYLFFLLIGFTVQAFGAGLIEPANSVIVVKEFNPASSRRIFSLIGIALGLAGIMAPVASTYIAAKISWQASFRLTALCAVVIAVFSFICLKNYKHKQSKASISLSTYLKPIIALAVKMNSEKFGFFTAVSLFNAFVLAGLTGLLVVCSVVLELQFHMPLIRLGEVFALSAVFYSIGIAISNVCCKYCSGKTVLRVCMVILFITTLLLISFKLRNTLEYFVGYFFFVNFIVGIIRPISISFALSPFAEFGEHEESAASMLSFTCNIFCAIAGFLIPIFDINSTVKIGLFVMGCFILAVIFLEVYIKKINRVL